jgi:hypothetical protein
MGYPIYARIGNLDVEIRNSNGIGGGELVGWLPIVGIKVTVQLKLSAWLKNKIYRSRKMKLRKVKKTTLILNVKSGTSPSPNCSKPLHRNLSQATGRDVVITLIGNYSLLSSYYLLTMKNSKSILISNCLKL